MASFDVTKAKEYLAHEWATTVIPTLENYIRVPNQSPSFDDKKNTHAKEAATILSDWVNSLKIPNTTSEVKQIGELAPVVLVVVEPTKQASPPTTVFLYGHYDKQPPLTGWTKPHDDPLFGRGSADDGYAALKKQNIPHDRYVVLIEGEEESGSPNLHQYVTYLQDIIATPELIVCLDSGSGNYDQLWLTTSLRGIVNGTLDAKILQAAAHSGSASGIVPSSFHIQRTLIDRLETDHNGVINNPAFNIEITPEMHKEAETVAKLLGDKIYKEFSFVPTGQPVSPDLPTLVINKTFKPTLSITGVDGIPAFGGQTSNVIRTNTSFLLSIRIPPGKKSAEAAVQLKQILEKDPPFGAEVVYTKTATGDGWKAPALADWLKKAVDGSGANFFNGKEVVYIHVYRIPQGEGGSIPFMNELAQKFPNAQFIVTGVLGPESNAHGPNEFLDTIYAKAVTGSIAYILYGLSQK